jgi:hypothetical protein
LLNALQKKLGYKVGASLKTTHTYTPGKVNKFVLQSVIKSKSKITKLSKAMKRVCCFTNKFPVSQRAEIQHKLDKISNNFFLLDRPLNMQQGNTHV